MNVLRNPYEKMSRKAQILRAIGYAFLWLFLAGMIYGINEINSYDYPMVPTAVLVLAIIGVIKLVYGIRFYQKMKAEDQD